MENLKDISSNNLELLNNLKRYNCKALYNGKVVYEGKFDPLMDFDVKDKTKLVYEFNINENNFIISAEKNKAEEKLLKLFENKKFNDIFSDPLLYNEAFTLANYLPLLNIEINENVYNKIKKYGLNARKIYETLLVNGLESEEDQITEVYDDIIEKLQHAKNNELPIEEGILGAIGGAILGASVGPKLGNAMCKALGVDPKGSFGSLLTSRLVMTAIGTTMGWKM